MILRRCPLLVSLASGYEFYLESSYSSNETEQVLAPVPAATFVNVNTDSPILTPEARQLFIDNYEVAPGIARFGVGRRLSEVGPRIIDHEREYWRTVLGLRGEIGNGWGIDGWVTYTQSTETQFLLNDASASRYLQGLLVDPLTGECFDPSNGCVLMDIFGEGRVSDEAVEFLRISDVRNDTERTQMLASVVIQGTPLETWAGALDTAFGIEWRSDDASFEADDVLFTGDTLGYRGDAPVDGRESVIELYAEALVPLARDQTWAEYFDLELGARYSVLAIPKIGSKHYLDLGLAYTIGDSITARAVISNLTDTDPPNMADAVVSNNTDSFLYDVFGRSYYLGLSARLFE